MSNRFGRNQKRRMREELRQKDVFLAFTHQQHIQYKDRARKVTDQLKDEIRQYIDIVRLTENVLGSYFTSLPEKKLQIARKKGHDIIGWLQHWPQPSTPLRAPCAPSELNRCVESTVRAIQMIEMALLEGAAWAEEARNIIHLRYYFADGQSAYSVSRQALKHLPKDHLKTTVAKECADLLVSELSKRGRR